MLFCKTVKSTTQKANQLFIGICIALTYVFCSQVAQANLMISPTRVLIEDRERVETIHLINSGSETRSYRIEFSEQMVDENGNYQEITSETSSDFPFASPYLRFSPSQVTLEPGQRQAIKILARRPQNLPTGDYRSHLNFIALPPKREENNDVNGIRMRLDVLMSYSIPVVLRRGEVSFQGKIEAVSIKPNPDKDIAEIVVTLSRAGTSSAYGKLLAQFKADGTEEIIEVGELNGVNFFPDQDKMQKSIVWRNYQPTQSGRLFITYQGSDELKGSLLAGGQVIVE